MILGVITITFAVNVLGDVLLIPVFKNEGAAIAYLMAMLIQCVAYLKRNDTDGLGAVWQPLLLCMLCAFLGGFIARYIFSNSVLIPIMAVGIYATALLLTKQLRLSDWKNIPFLFN